MTKWWASAWTDPPLKTAKYAKYKSKKFLCNFFMSLQETREYSGTELNEGGSAVTVRGEGLSSLCEWRFQSLDSP